MSCLRCSHAVPVNWPENLGTHYLYGEEYTEADRNKAVVKCTLNPIWIDVRATHFCSHDTSGMSAGEHNAWALRAKSAWKEAKEQRERAISAEKKLKELRRKMRESK